MRLDFSRCDVYLTRLMSSNAKSKGWGRLKNFSAGPNAPYRVARLVSKIQGKSCYQYHRVDGVRDIVEVYLSTDQCDFIVAKSLQDAIDQNQPAVAPVASTPEA